MTLLKKMLVAFAGGALLVVGLAMLVLPGPAVVVVPAALAILAVEFLWARRWLAWLRDHFRTFFPKRPAKWFNTRAETGVRVATRIASRASTSKFSGE